MLCTHNKLKIQEDYGESSVGKVLAHFKHEKPKTPINFPDMVMCAWNPSSSLRLTGQSTLVDELQATGRPSPKGGWHL